MKITKLFKKLFKKNKKQYKNDSRKTGLDTAFVPHDKTYRYNVEKNYFKTKKGKKAIRISAAEALDILEMHKAGETPNTIFNELNFQHNPVTIGTVKHFIKQWEKGYMDIAINYVCNNKLFNEDPQEFCKYYDNILAYNNYKKEV